MFCMLCCRCALNLCCICVVDVQLRRIRIVFVWYGVLCVLCLGRACIVSVLYLCCMLLYCICISCCVSFGLYVCCIWVVRLLELGCICVVCWFHYGLYLDCVWIDFLCLDRNWFVFGMYLECRWTVVGLCLGRVLIAFVL